MPVEKRVGKMEATNILTRFGFKVQEIFASCPTCIHCRIDDDPNNKVQAAFCKKFQQYPPLEVVINSCVEHFISDDDIPF